jgi:hypothetical protein
MRNQKHLYLGKAAGTSVWTHWDADDKHEKVWHRIKYARDIFEVDSCSDEHN